MKDRTGERVMLLHPPTCSPTHMFKMSYERNNHRGGCRATTNPGDRHRHVLGALPSLESTDIAEEKVYEPDRARHAIYQEAIARQRWLYDRLIAASYLSG